MARSKTLAPATLPLPVENEAVPRGGIPLTVEDRLARIAALGQRITTYVQFMCQIGGLTGSSAEAKDTAIRAFHERLAAAERQLEKIRDELCLG